MSRILVRSGSVYRVPRPGKPACHVRITRVSRRSSQPRVSYVLVTRGGRRARLSRRWERSAERFVTWLQFRDRAWRLPPHWTLVTGAGRRRRIRAAG